MSDRESALSAIRAFLIDPSDGNAEVLRPHLADDVVVAVHTTNENGPKNAIRGFQKSLFKNVVYDGRWEDPQTAGDVTTQALTMPPQAIAAGCDFKFTFDGDTKLARIEGGWVLPPAELAPMPVELTPAIRTRIDSAEDDKMPVLFAYVTAEGRPEQVYRSTTHTRGTDQLAFWNPRPNGRLVDAIAKSPTVSAIYRHSDTHEMLEMSGEARVIEEERESEEIYRASEQAAQDCDPQRKGVAVAINLNRVTGLIHAAETGVIERILMDRNGSG